MNSAGIGQMLISCRSLGEYRGMFALTEDDRGNAYVRAHPDGFVWTFFADPDAHRTTRRAATRMFAAPLATGGDHDIPAALPELPFDDRTFDLVLSSHLLFSYSDRLDLDFHHRAIAEMVRVARSEVRVYPLVAVAEDTTIPRLGQLLRDLDRDGIRAHTTEVGYEFQRGARRMLVCTRR